ncbi:hypothetical protein [Paraburkholderia sp. RL17-373-BIF-A]|uniref:hypothetical protein n=1 Tax=Paraburkholderia sp. RL17-373-BIF-A TaxID=3031629 RepID=UPI0038B76FA3
MTIDESNQVEELLTGWYGWQRGYSVNLGAGRVDPSCRGFDESDRFATIEERTDAAERKAQRKQAEQVDLCVDSLTWQQRAAIQTHMRQKDSGQIMDARIAALNDGCGVAAWCNPRKFDLSFAHELYQEAKFALLPALRRRGLIKGEVAA